jgi:hypothetical protein
MFALLVKNGRRSGACGAFRGLEGRLPRLRSLSASYERAALAEGFLSLARAEAVLQEHYGDMDPQL